MPDSPHLPPTPGPAGPSPHHSPSLGEWPLSLASRCSKLLTLLNSLSAALPGYAVPLRVRLSVPLLWLRDHFYTQNQTFTSTQVLPISRHLPPATAQSPKSRTNSSGSLLMPLPSPPCNAGLIPAPPLAGKPLTTTKPSQFYLQMPSRVSSPGPIQSAILSPPSPAPPLVSTHQSR